MVLDRLRPTAAVLLLVGAAAAPHADAAGFAIFEQGARGMGFAGAFTAQANDASAIFHNPAGIAFLKGNQLHLGGTLIAPSADFVGADPFPGSAVAETSDAGMIVPPVLDFTHQLTNQLVVGIGVHVPFGLKTEWANPATYTGRFISKRAELKGFSINPTVAYKLADRLSVGGGVDIRFASVSLDRNIGAINPFTLQVTDVASVALKSNTNHGIGFDLGLLAKPNDSLSIGLSYRHKVKVDFDGTATFTHIPTGSSQLDLLVGRQVPAGDVPVTTSVEFPSFVSGGVAYTWNDWTFEGDVNWYQWSSFESLTLDFEGLDPQVIPEGYENAFQFRFGAEKRIGDTWAVRGGYFYDQSPTPDASVGPLLPDADRNGACLGGGWKKGQLRLDAAFWYLFFKDRPTNGANRDNYNGIYSNSAALFALSLGYGF